ncbi:MAG: FAD-dependent oxidoreductase [Phenylobacterium sp.]
MDSAFDADLLVVGGGMAGMSAACWAADQGARVLVVEKAAEIGGSAVLSAGMFWTAADAQDIATVDPEQDRAFGPLLVEGYDAGANWMESLGVHVGPEVEMGQALGWRGRGRAIDVLGHVRTCRAHVQAAGGWVITDATVECLATVDGRVTGARVRDRDGTTEVRAPHVLLATGGYQGSDELLRKYYGDHAAGLLLRANPNSTGDGIVLAESVGGVMRTPAPSFYGHLLPSPLHRPLTPADFGRISQYYTGRALLFDKQGQRFVDESDAHYYGNAVAVSQQPGRRALVVGDDRLRQEDLAASYPGQGQNDRVLEAKRDGAHAVLADSMEALDAAVRDWGYSGISAGVALYNSQIEAGDAAMTPGRKRCRDTFTQAPFFAVEVQPAITFTFRGLRTDVDGRVLDADGRPIPGLLAAGADAAFYKKKYFGGLSMSLIFALRAARTALAQAPVPAPAS